MADETQHEPAPPATVLTTMCGPDPMEGDEFPPKPPTNPAHNAAFCIAAGVMVAGFFGCVVPSGPHWLWWVKVVIACAGLSLILVGMCALPQTAAVVLFPMFVVVAPIVARRSRFYIPIEPAPTFAVPDGFPPGSAERLAARRADLEREGFVSLGMFYLEPSGKRGEKHGMVIEAFEHAVERHGVTTMLTKFDQLLYKDKPLTTRFLDLNSEGVPIATIASGAPGAFPRLPNHEMVMSMPLETPVAELYRVHRAMLARFAPGLRIAGPRALGTIKYLVSGDAYANDFWIARRWVRPTGTPKEYRLSTLLCLRMGWGLMPGVVGWRRKRMYQKYDRRRAQWGM